MEQTRKIITHGKNFMIVKPSKERGEEFEKIGCRYSLKGLASFLENIGRNGNKERVICDKGVQQKLKEYYINQDENTHKYLLKHPEIKEILWLSTIK